MVTTCLILKLGQFDQITGYLCLSHPWQYAQRANFWDIYYFLDREESGLQRYMATCHAHHLFHRWSKYVLVYGFCRCKSDVNFQFAFLIVFVSWVKNYIYKSRRARNLNFSWLRWLFCFDFHRLIRCIPQGLWLPKAKGYLHQCLRPAAQVGTWKTWDPWKLGPRRLNKWASLVLQVWRTKDIELYIIYSRNV